MEFDVRIDNHLSIHNYVKLETNNLIASNLDKETQLMDKKKKIFKLKTTWPWLLRFSTILGCGFIS